MEITRTQRLAAEQKALPAQLSLYDTPEAGAQLRSMATKYQINDTKAYRSLALMVGDIVLGFYQQSDIPALINHNLAHLSGAERIALEADIKIFLLPLTEPPATSASDAVLDNEIAEAEQALSSLQSVRTMQNDMRVMHGEEPVYSSTQADILPSNNGPKWDSES